MRASRSFLPCISRLSQRSLIYESFSKHTGVQQKWSIGKRFCSRGRKRKEFSVDPSGLQKLSPLSQGEEQTSDVDVEGKTVHWVEKEDLTELGCEIKQSIQMRGPMSISEYMSLATSHSVLGYYHQVAFTSVVLNSNTK